MHVPIQTPAFFQNEPLPKGAELAGWTALVNHFGIRAPVRKLSCVSGRHVRGNRRTENSWELYDKRYRPEPTLLGHLTFALRHESLDLLVLGRVLEAAPQSALIGIVQAAPTGAVARRIWFFYESLTGKRLDLEDAPAVTAVDAIDPAQYITWSRGFSNRGDLSARHRVRDNLLGTGAFCPVIRRTAKLEAFIASDMPARAREIIGRAGAQIIARAASFMLLADSRASFEIEGERPAANRLERWGKAVLEAGKRPLNQTEIYRLQEIIIGEDRFTPIGYRQEGVFLGERDNNNEPLPEFIGARHQDIPELMLALNQCNNRLRASDVDPVLQAAAIAFGFVYIHPLADGNGRLHRCLIHHVLAERKFTPPGMVFPVSTVMLERIDDYRTTLHAHTGPLMEAVDWRALPNGNVDVINDTSDLYRFFDCTAAAEFLCECVQRTVEEDLPGEIKYLKAHDEAMRSIMNAVEMPDRLAASLILFIRQNEGKLGRKRREGEFSRLTNDEVELAEGIVNAAFEGAAD